MARLSQKQQEILSLFLVKGVLSSSSVHAELVHASEEVSLVTVKRALSAMAKQGVLAITGSGRATRYGITALGRMFAAVNAHEYCALEPDRRSGQSRYNFALFPAMPPEVFSDDELQLLAAATAQYESRARDLPPAIQQKELERLIIELSRQTCKI